MMFDGAPWRFAAPPKCLPLLAMLALRREPVSRASLAAQLWPDETDSIARANLRRHLYQTARALPEIAGVEWIVSAGSGLAWNHAAPASIDVIRFLELLAVAESASEAATLYGGDFLESCMDEAVIYERERLRTMYLELLGRLASQARDAHDHGAARGYADAILAIDEWREDALRIAMEARYLTGDRSGALATFEAFARRLDAELSGEPMRETLVLRDAILADRVRTQEDPSRGERATLPIVGRDDVIAELKRSWQRAARGGGTTVFLTGEAGIGKSRLASELLEIAQAEGGAGIIGRTSLPESVAYQPIVEALRQLVPYFPQADEHRPWLSALRPFLPEIAGLQWDSLENESLNNEHSDLRLQEALVRAFAFASRARPLAIVFEDLHLAHDGTIALFESLADRIAGLPILLVATYRSTDLQSDTSLRAVRRRLARASRATQLTLAPLALDDVRKLLELLGEPADAASDVFASSAGNPLFTWQLLHARSESNDRDGFVTLEDALLARASTLSPDVRLVADVAATIGDTFTVEEIAEVARCSESDAGVAIATLVDRYFLTSRGGSSFEYSFTHALIAKALYDATDPQVRPDRHRRAATILTLTRAEYGHGYALIAEHWLRAGERERARVSLLRAADAALAMLARSDTQRHAQRVLALEPTQRERFTALLLIVKSMSRSGATHEIPALLDELHPLAQTLSSNEQLEAIGASLDFYNEQGDRERASAEAARLRELAVACDNKRWIHQSALFTASIKLYSADPAGAEEVLRSITPWELDDEMQRHNYYRSLSQALFRQLRFDEAKALLATFREYLTRKPSSHGEHALALSEMTGAWLTDDPLLLKASAERVVRLSQQRGDLFDEARARSNLAYVKHQLHETSAAREEYARTLELYERSGHVQNVLITKSNAGMIEFETGHIDRAERLWLEVEREAKERGVTETTFAIGNLVNLAELSLYRGEAECAKERAQRAYDLASATRETWLQANAQTVLGAAACACGDFDTGFAHLKQSVEAVRSQPRSFINNLALYLDAILDAGSTNNVASAASELLEAFEKDDPLDQQYPARVCLTLSRAAAALGDETERERMLVWGRELVETRMQAFTEPEDREAYAAMWPNVTFLAPIPSM